MKRKVLFILILLTVHPGFSGSGQTGRLYTSDQLEWMNPWLRTSNPAGMVFNSAFLNDSVRSFNDASLRAQFRSGKFRNVYDPAGETAGDLGIDSYMKLGKVFLHGCFGFRYDHGEESRWRGFVNPYRSPFMLADSIPGNTSDENYTMQAAFALPLGSSFALGGEMTYRASIFSKHRDLRNKNTVMDFSITPGFLFLHPNVRAGIDFGYTRNTEKVEYLQIDPSQEKYLFELFGQWLFRSTGYSGAETGRIVQENGFGGNFQLDLHFGGFRLLNGFGARYRYGEQTETHYNNFRYGDTESLTYSDDLTLQFGERHLVQAGVLFCRMFGYTFLQQEELDPDSKIRVWVTYGDPVLSYLRDVRRTYLRYTYRHTDSFREIPWEFAVGLQEHGFSQENREHPLYFRQETEMLEPSVQFTFRWCRKAERLEFRPELSYAQQLKASRNEIYNNTNIETPADHPWQLLQPLNEEFDFFSSSRVGAGIKIGYIHVFSQHKGLGLYIDAGYRLKCAVSRSLSGRMRHETEIAAGIRF